MFSASLYQPVYLLIVTLMTFYAMSLYNKRGKQYNAQNASKTIAFLLLFIIVWFIGTRPTDGVYFVDMANYRENYDVLFSEHFWFDKETDNIIFDNLFYYMASKRMSFGSWVMLMSIAYFGLMFWACRKVFDKDVLLAFVVYLAAFSSFSYGTNGIKAGVAASLFLVAIAYRDKLWISIPMALLTYGFHHSMLMVIAAYFIVLFFKNPKYYFIGWIVCVIIATLHIKFFQVLFARFTDDQGAQYLLATEGGGHLLAGFRPDFILYSAVPIYMGYQTLNKYHFKSTTYSFILRLYILTNAIWMLCMYASYTNRIAYLSWFMYPFVLLYPFINREKDQLQGKLQGKYLQYVVYGHLAFTLFMMFIYY